MTQLSDPGASRPTRTTPDGQQLAGWLRRFAALVLDAVFVLPLYALAAAPFVIGEWGDLKDWYREARDARAVGLPEPPRPELLQHFSPTQLTVYALVLAMVAVYTLGFWRWKQATPGKLIVGTRVRLRERPGPMPWPAMLIRFFFIQPLGWAASIPVIGALFTLTILLNYLWPLWDPKRQTFYDKAAGTNVVLATAEGPASGSTD